MVGSMSGHLLTCLISSAMNDETVKNIAEADIDAAFQELLDCYLASTHRKKVDVIQKAFNFARRAHQDVRRLSGEPYIMHPIAVALIASKEMGLGSTSICAALLHDVVENTDYTLEDIENIFGSKIAQIVEGLTKISGGIFGDKASDQAENFKKLLLTMSDDIRVILIKICDRLHNMRTLDRQPASKQYKIAGETLYLYAPLANRLGLNKIKTELEDLAFKYEHPESYSNIESKLAHTREQREMLFENFVTPIREALDAMGTNYTIKARIKSPYSIWSKMRRKHVSFDEIYDILAVRIIFTPKVREEEVNECFNIYVALCKLYKSHPERFRDWLSHPKSNGYQALQVTLMSNQGRWIEVQIRSDRMDEIAEQGFAAHWKYKAGDEKGNGSETANENELNDWLLTIKEILDDPQPDAMDFLDAIKLNLFASEIFVFTPKGEIITMPADCTALDFAFHIHTFLGTHCIGAKVNHKLVPLSHKLQGGDQVEIITSNSQHVQESWLNFVTTAKARNKIMALLRKEEREQQREGNKLLSQWLEAHELTLSTGVLDRLTSISGLQDSTTLLIDIGRKKIQLNDELHEKLLRAPRSDEKKSKKGNWRKYIPFLKKKNAVVAAGDDYVIADSNFDRDRSVVLTEENLSHYVFPETCCKPVAGDDVLGYINNQGRIEIHQRSCPVAQRLKTTYGNRILDVRWDMLGDQLFNAAICIKGIDRKGLARDVASAIADDLDIDIKKLTLSSDEGIFEGRIEVRIHDKSELVNLIDVLRSIDGLQTVSREI